jgi:hypothetical protein
MIAQRIATGLLHGLPMIEYLQAKIQGWAPARRPVPAPGGAKPLVVLGTPSSTATGWLGLPAVVWVCDTQPHSLRQAARLALSQAG